MSDDSESKEAESDVTNKSDESDAAPTEKISNVTAPSQEQSKATAPSQEQSKATPPSQEQSKATAPSQEQSKATAPSQEQSKATAPSQEQSKATAPSQKQSKATAPSQEQSKATAPSKEQSKATAPSQKETKPTESNQQKMSPESSQKQQAGLSKSNSDPEAQVQEQSPSTQKTTGSVRQMVIWTMTGFFDFNPRYFRQVRGLLNLLHVIFALTDVILLALDCQLMPYPHAPSEGFFCRPPETFLFVASCCSFITSVVYLICCLLSKSTDVLLFQSSFEVGYFILYFVMLLTASLTVIVSDIQWGREKGMYESENQSSQIAAIIGLLNSIMYGIGAIWFFLSHRYAQTDVVERSDYL